MWQFQSDAWSEEVYRARSPRSLDENALVLEALGIPYNVRRNDGWYIIRVDAAFSDRARRELNGYRRENRDRFFPPSRPPLALARGAVHALPYAGILVLVDLLRGFHAFHLSWWSAGRTHSELIVSGQWWRCVTALTLHADIAHLAGNLVFGSIFFALIRADTGSGLAWLLILLGGAFGNALNALLQGPGHTSVGASTAVFSALGTLTALAWSDRRGTTHPALVRAAPLVAGAVLLAFLGTGGERTDVGAHLTGFLCGLLLGVALAFFATKIPRETNAQKIYAGLTLAALGLSWMVALM